MTNYWRGIIDRLHRWDDTLSSADRLPPRGHLGSDLIATYQLWPVRHIFAFKSITSSSCLKFSGKDSGSLSQDLRSRLEYAASTFAMKSHSSLSITHCSHYSSVGSLEIPLHRPLQHPLQLPSKFFVL